LEKNKFIPEDKPEADSVEFCPHCGIKLSRWEQVLLKVDRALMCKNCWYRIILTPYEVKQKNSEDADS